MLSLLLNIFNLLVIVIVLNKISLGKIPSVDTEELPVMTQYLYCAVPEEFILDAPEGGFLPAEIKGPYSFFTQLNLPIIAYPDRVEITDYGSTNAGQV